MLGISLSASDVEGLRRYVEEVLRWRSRLNLTGASTEAALVNPHLLDVLLLLRTVEIPRGASVVDIGAGAGLPGVPLRILRPDIREVLVEASRRKVGFLEHLQTTLGLVDLRIEWGRAESLARRDDMREHFDLSVTQAAGRVAASVELSVPFVKVGGASVLLKGSRLEDEISEARGLICALGAHLEAGTPRALPTTSTIRTIVVLRKRSVTPDLYPRVGSSLGRPARRDKGTSATGAE
jgi:16S rRNA (guanine527-N7)-methyltransferase